MAQRNIGKVRKTPSPKPTVNLKPQAQHNRNLNKNSTGKEDGPTDLLEETIKKFKAARSYARKGFWTTWDQNWKLYNNKRVLVGYDGNTEAFVPETFTLLQSIKAHLVNGNLEVEFLPTHAEQTGDVAVLQDLFNYAWTRDYMDQKVDSAIDEMLVTGNGYVFTFVGDNGLPCSRYVACKDAFFDPQATSYWDLGYCGFRYLTTLDTLKDEKITNATYDNTDPSSEAKVQRYSNLDNLGVGYKDYGNDKTAKQEREEMVAGSTLEDTKEVVECIVFIDKERMITIANRIEIIEDVDTPFKRDKTTKTSVDDQGNEVKFDIPEIKPFLPVAPFRDIVDGSMFYAKGAVEVIAESQERLNDVQAQKSDNLSYQLNRMWALDPAYAQKIDEIQSVPGAVFTIPPGALEQIPTQPIGADADNEINRIKSEMSAATAANELVQGNLQTTGRPSAYQINQQLVMAGSRFQVKIRQLENEAFRILVMNMWKVMQIYIDKEIPIRVAGSDSQMWGTYNPGLFLGDWDVKIMLGARAEAVKETNRQQSMQFYLLASKMPFINQEKLFAMTATELFEKTKREVQNLILPPDPQPKPTVVPKLIESVKFGELYPDEQGELLSESGITPSPLREQATGIPNPPANPAAAALHTDIIHSNQGAPTPEDSSQTGLPGRQMANLPKVPNV